MKPRFEAMAPRDLKGGKLAYGILRSRFGIDAAVAGGWSAYLQLQDTRYFGGLRVADGFPPDITVWGRAPEAFDLHQGYTQWKRDCFAVRVGRQEITYGNERLIGTLDWANPGRTFDAIKFDYNKDAYSAAAFGAVLADSAPTSRGPDSVLAGSFFEHKRKGAINWGGIALYDATVHVTPSQRVTLGGRVWGPIGKLEFDIDAYGQVNKGKNLDATHAYLLGARAKYAFSKTHKGGFLIDYVSGASSSNAHAFHTLYGTNHKFYGFYDFFLNLPKDTGGQGLVDAALTGDWVIGTATLAAYAHLFGAATYNGAGSAWYGMEPDVVLGLPLVDKVKSEFGVSAFIPFGDALGRGDKMGWFSYAQLSIKL